MQFEMLAAMAGTTSKTLIKIANRKGYTIIEFLDRDTFVGAVKKYHTRSETAAV